MNFTGSAGAALIPPVRDQIVQAALKIVLEPVFEADFLPVSSGFRPRRSAHDARRCPSMSAGSLAAACRSLSFLRRS